MSIESFLEGHVRVFDWPGGVPRECVYDKVRSVMAKRDDRAALRGLPPTTLDFSLSRTVRVPADGYLRHGACFYRAPTELVHQRVELHASSACWAVRWAKPSDRRRS